MGGAGRLLAPSLGKPVQAKLIPTLGGGDAVGVGEGSDAGVGEGRDVDDGSGVEQPASKAHSNAIANVFIGR